MWSLSVPRKRCRSREPDSFPNSRARARSAALQKNPERYRSLQASTSQLLVEAPPHTPSDTNHEAFHKTGIEWLAMRQEWRGEQPLETRLTLRRSVRFARRSVLPVAQAEGHLQHMLPSIIVRRPVLAAPATAVLVAGCGSPSRGGGPSRGEAEGMRRVHCQHEVSSMKHWSVAAIQVGVPCIEFCKRRLRRQARAARKRQCFDKRFIRLCYQLAAARLQTSRQRVVAQAAFICIGALDCWRGQAPD